MPAGVPTSAEVEAQFRAHYLYSGNAGASARAVGLPESTGRDIAQRLIDDPAFVEDRRRLRTRALDELVSMRMRVAKRALTRFESKTGGIDVKDFSRGDNSTVTITDKRHDYGKLVLEAEKNAQHLAKIEGERSGQSDGSREVVINITGPDSTGKNPPDRVE